MTRLLLTVTFTAMLASLAEAQPMPDPRIADLVQDYVYEGFPNR